MNFKAIRRKLIYWCFLISPFILCQLNCLAKATTIRNLLNNSTQLSHISGIDLNLRSIDDFTVDLANGTQSSFVVELKPLIVSSAKEIKITTYELNDTDEIFISSVNLQLRKKHSNKPMKFSISLGRFETDHKEILFKINDTDGNLASVMKANFTALNLEAQPILTVSENQCDSQDVDCAVRKIFADLNPRIGRYSSVQENSSGGFDITFAVPKKLALKVNNSQVSLVDEEKIQDESSNSSDSSSGESNTTETNLVTPNSFLASDKDGNQYWRALSSIERTQVVQSTLNVSGLSSQMIDLKNQFTALNNTVEVEQQEDIDNLQTQITNMNSLLSSVNNSNDADISNLNSQVANLTGVVSTLSDDTGAEIDDLKTQVADLTSLVATLNAALTNLQTQFTDHVNNEAIHVDPTPPMLP